MFLVLLELWSLSPDDILNNNESNKTYFSANVSNFLIADFEDGSLFCNRYRYKSLKYGLHR